MAYSITYSSLLDWNGVLHSLGLVEWCLFCVSLSGVADGTHLLEVK